MKQRTHDDKIAEDDDSGEKELLYVK